MDNAALFQRTIKENNDDLQDFLDGMKSWEDEIKKKDELLSKQKPILKKARRVRVTFARSIRTLAISNGGLLCGVKGVGQRTRSVLKSAANLIW